MIDYSKRCSEFPARFAENLDRGITSSKPADLACSAKPVCTWDKNPITLQTRLNAAQFLHGVQRRGARVQVDDDQLGTGSSNCSKRIRVGRRLSLPGRDAWRFPLASSEKTDHPCRQQRVALLGRSGIRAGYRCRCANGSKCCQSEGKSSPGFSGQSPGCARRRSRREHRRRGP